MVHRRSRECGCGCGETFVGNYTRVYIDGHRRNNPERRFWRQVNTGSPEECWTWLGGRANKGYGSFWNGERKVGAHQFAWDVTNPGRTTEWVLHKCDNPPCVNPNHLFLGDNTVNVRDMWAKGRGYSYFQERSRENSVTPAP